MGKNIWRKLWTYQSGRKSEGTFAKFWSFLRMSPWTSSGNWAGVNQCSGLIPFDKPHHRLMLVHNPIYIYVTICFGSFQANSLDMYIYIYMHYEAKINLSCQEATSQSPKSQINPRFTSFGSPRHRTSPERCHAWCWYAAPSSPSPVETQLHPRSRGVHHEKWWPKTIKIWKSRKLSWKNVVRTGMNWISWLFRGFTIMFWVLPSTMLI